MQKGIGTAIKVAVGILLTIIVIGGIGLLLQ